MLDQIADYAFRTFPDMEPGFGPALVKWRLSLNKDPKPTLEPFGGENGSLLSNCPEYPDNLMQGGGKSHFLVDTLQVMFLLLDKKKDDAAKYGAKHDFFVSMLKDAAAQAADLQIAAAFFADKEQLGRARDRLVELGAKPTDKAFFQIDCHSALDDENARAWWRDTRAKLLAESVAKPKTMICLLSGDPAIPAQTHPKISGLKIVGGRGQDNVVAYDKRAFQSFRLDQAENGAMSESMANAYSKGLDDLIRNHSRKLANALVVHWFKDSVPVADDPLAWLDGMEPDEQTEATAQARARELLDAIRSGIRADLGQNRYYAMTLSGASGRVMVRHWMEGEFKELVQSVGAWFSDLEITAAHDTSLARDPKFFEICLALIRNDRSKSITSNLEKLPAPVSATLWKAAIQHLPIPQPVLAMALAQFRSERFTPDDKNREVFNHARMGLIKAYYVRRQPEGDTTVTAYLNPDHPDPAYHCGRLLAVFASLQRAALGDVGAGVVQRYYAAASQTPGLVLGRLAANARNHLGKLEGGLAFLFEGKIADVMSRLGDGAPRFLDLEGQGLFALGYYQQLAALRQSTKANGKDLPDTPDSTTGDKQ